MNILCIGSRPNRTGVSGLRLAFELIVRHLEEVGHQVAVVDTTWRAEDHSPGRFSVGRATEVLVAVAAALVRMPTSDRVYLTLSTSRLGFIRDCILIHAASLLGRPTVAHLHGGGYRAFYEDAGPVLRRIVRATLSRLDALVVLGERLRDQFDFLDGAGPAIRVVPNGLPLGVPEPGSRTAYPEPEPETAFRLLYLSNLVPSKGYLDVVEACEILIAEGLPVECHLCGAFVTTEADAPSDESPETGLRRTLDRPALQGRVFTHGTVGGEEKTALLESCHALVLPTYYPWEGQPLAIIEALAYGIPVVSTEHRGIPEQLIDGVNGYFCEPRNPASVAAALRRVWQGPTPYLDLRRNARRHYERHFTREVHLARLEAVITGQPGPVPP